MTCKRLILDNEMLARWFCSRKFTRNKWLLGLFVLLFILEECFFDGIFRLFFANLYYSEFTIPISTYRDSNVSIGIVVVIDSAASSHQYSLAQDSVRCYAELHSYSLHYIDISEHGNLTDMCPQNDFMLRRHCFISYLSQEWAEQWLLFLDADIGVINPNHLIERYIPTVNNTYFVFYDRIFNHEIMAGSYLFRNSNSSRSFLLSWANYENKLPNSFHGSDNGAIHSALIDYYSSVEDDLHNICKVFWKKSKDYRSLSHYEVCARVLLRKSPPSHVAIIGKGRLSWARDGWLTNSQWSSNDFMFHGWQYRRLDKRVFGEWHSPLVQHKWNHMLCSNRSTAHLNWRYKDSFFRRDVDIDRILHDKIASVSTEKSSIESTMLAKTALANLL